MLNVKYVLFSHFCPPASEERSLLGEYLLKIQDILKSESNPGVLILFYDPGWLSLLNTVGRDFDPATFTQEFGRASELQSFADSQLQVPESEIPRIRFVTCADLFQIVNNIRGERPGRAATRLRRFLTGSKSGRAASSRYDTSKVVEAIVRLRQVGSGIPVFRIDWDALFNDETIDSKLRFAIKTVVDNYSDLHNHSSVYSFVTSGSYVVKNRDARPTERPVESWLTAYATRVMPALLATDELLDSVGPLAEDTLQASYRANLVKDFYGLDDLGTDIMKNDDDDRPARGITCFGSNPLKAVISGALLGLSDGAILDLPPFSNFRQNVSWIDDHLKYALHRELQHFSQEPTYKEGRKITARVVEAEVLKSRPSAQNVGFYTLGNYLPTLLFGTVMDAWIQPDPRANVANLTAEQRRRRAEILPPGPFPQALAESLRTGILTKKQVRELESQLKEKAMKRIACVAEQWSELVIDGQKSIAALWVTHSCIQRIPGMDAISEEMDLKDDWIGWGLFIDPSPARRDKLKNLNPALLRGLEMLIEDTINYVKWTLDWPTFMRAVRAIPPGELKSDLRWRVAAAAGDES